MMDLTKLAAGDRVELLFDDFTTRDSGWQDLAEAEQDTLAEIRLVGIYLNHDDRVIRLAFGLVVHDSSVCTLAMVPVGALKLVKKLGVAD